MYLGLAFCFSGTRSPFQRDAKVCKHVGGKDVMMSVGTNRLDVDMGYNGWSQVGRGGGRTLVWQPAL